MYLPPFVIEMHNVYIYFQLMKNDELIEFFEQCIKGYYVGDLDRIYIMFEGRYNSLFKHDLGFSHIKSLLIVRSILHDKVFK